MYKNNETMPGTLLKNDLMVDMLNAPYLVQLHLTREALIRTSPESYQISLRGTKANNNKLTTTTI
jgi:hypothetical protein